RGLPCEGIAPVWPARPVDGVLQAAGNRAGVFRSHEEDGVGGGDGLLECASFGRVIGIVVVAVERQFSDGDLVEFEFGWSELDQRVCELPVDGVFRETA